MLHGRKKAVLTGLLALAAAALLSGCSTGEDDFEMPDFETETEFHLLPAEEETETETETETEALDNVVFISEDGTIRILLPDTTWEATQDTDEMRVFSSGSDAMINIVHAGDETAMQNISVMKTEEELEESLTGQYPEEDAFEILSFETRSSSTIDIYEYVVNYKYSTSMWAYSVTYGILAADETAAYVVSGTVTEDDEDLLDEVQTSVESFSVLDTESVFHVLPGKVTNNNSSDDDDDEESGSQELSTLTTYASGLTLYAAEDVNIRKNPSTSADLLGMLEAGDAVTVTGETTNWFQVSVNGSTGYVNKAYLSYTEVTQTEASAETSSLYDSSYTYYTTTGVNLRSSPSTDADVLGGLSGGVAVTVIGETDDWYVVSYNGTTAYISKGLLTSEQPADTGTTDTATETTDTTASTGAGTYDSGTVGMLYGTITNIDGTTIALQGTDGNMYYIEYTNAGSLSIGSTVTATVDYGQVAANGAPYATSVN